MGTSSALLTLCKRNPPVTGGFPSQRASNTGFDIFFDVSSNKRLSKQSSAGDLRRHGAHWYENYVKENKVLSCIILHEAVHQSSMIE